MIRSLLVSPIPRKLCQVAIGTRDLKTLFKHSFPAREYLAPSVLPPITKPNTRAMSSGDGRDLFYDDIVKLSSEKSIVLVDVREPDEIKETGLLPGSVHIPLGEVPDALKASPEDFKLKYGIEKPGQAAPLVFSCRSGKRSRMALSKALELGFANSKHYAGGWLDWESKVKG